MTQRTSSLTRAILAPNPGPMTLDGTNSYLIGRPGTSLVVVDPGPADGDHIAALAAEGPIGLILITHHHADHTAASEQLHRITGAPVRALDPAHCHGGEPLVDGEVLEAGGTSIRVIATPGHTADSVCFHLPDDGAHGSVLTGDTILGRSTTVIIPGDGSLAAYLSSLDSLAELGPAWVLPAHGPTLPDLATVCATLKEHRMRRLDEVRKVVATLGDDASVHLVTDRVYGHIDPAVRFAAEASVESQLDFLRSAR